MERCGLFLEYGTVLLGWVETVLAALGEIRAYPIPAFLFLSSLFG